MWDRLRWAAKRKGCIWCIISARQIEALQEGKGESSLCKRPNRKGNQTWCFCDHHPRAAASSSQALSPNKQKGVAYTANSFSKSSACWLLWARRTSTWRSCLSWSLSSPRYLSASVNLPLNTNHTHEMTFSCVNSLRISWGSGRHDKCLGSRLRLVIFSVQAQVSCFFACTLFVRRSGVWWWDEKVPLL